MARLKIKEVAVTHGIQNAAELSREAKIAYSTAYALWGNPDYSANFDTLKAIARALHVRVSDLIEEDHDPAAHP